MATKRRGPVGPKAKRPGRATAEPEFSTEPPPGLRRDTPIEFPGIERGELIEAPRLTLGARAASQRVLARVFAIETIESAYDAWLELRLHEAQTRAGLLDELRRLDEQGALLVGAVRVAGGLEGPAAPALATAGLAGFLAQAEEQLAAVRRQLDAQLAEAETTFTAAVASIRDEIRARVERRAKAVKPRLRLMVRTLADGCRVLHAQRPDPDDAVALLFVLSGRIPSRYGFLFDDSTEDSTRPPPTLYAEEGVAPAQTRPTAAQLRSVLAPRGSVWPVKGMLPMELAPLGGSATTVRWLERGPVMEAEIEDGDGFRGVLTREEAERITGHLLALKLEARVELELVHG